MEGKVRTGVDPEARGPGALMAQGMDRRTCLRGDWRKTVLVLVDGRQQPPAVG